MENIFRWFRRKIIKAVHKYISDFLRFFFFFFVLQSEVLLVLTIIRIKVHYYIPLIQKKIYFNLQKWFRRKIFKAVHKYIRDTLLFFSFLLFFFFFFFIAIWSIICTDTYTYQSTWLRHAHVCTICIKI